MTEAAALTSAPPAPADEAPVLFERRSQVGIVTLNRPKALNALSLPMVQAIRPQLAAWARDGSVEAVVLQGAGDRAFCAGGDIREAFRAIDQVRAGELPADAPSIFFRDEYRLNHELAVYPKPIVSLLHGITMGGGCGLSLHTSFRVATQNLSLAMPETGIGLFPDVGIAHLLARLPGRWGWFLALTGLPVGAAAARGLGLVTHVLAGEGPAPLATLLERIVAADLRGDARDRLQRILDEAVAPSPASVPLPHADLVEAAFGARDLAGVLAALDRSTDPEAAAWARLLRHRSPTSLLVTWRHMADAARLSLAAVLEQDFRITRTCLAGHDFREGVRAQVIDKDRNPRWQPATLAEVPQDLIERHFAVGADDLVLTQP